MQHILGARSCHQIVQGRCHLYGKLCFRTENYIATTTATTIKERFDVILCLSTIKYVHLNFGDIGIKALFLKAFHQLEDGGLFVIDPQPWKSYKKKKKISETTQENFNEINLKPNLFREYLETIGFQLVATIAAGDKDEKPLIVYKKGQ